MDKKKTRDAIDNIPAEKLKPERVEKNNKKNRLINIMNYLAERYQFRYNLFIQKPEVRAVKSGNGFISFDQRSYDNLWNEVKIDLGAEIPRADFESLIGSDRMSVDYDPIQEFIFSLPEWDGVDRFPDFLKQIQLTRNEEKDRERLVKYFTRWFAAMVATLLDDHIINEWCLVFTGKQGRGKTRFFTSLVPQELRRMYFYSGSFDPHDKDQREMLGTKVLINLDEMATLTRTDIETLKSAMSERYVVLRRAYGRAPIHLYRRASFCGSNNDDRFLTDQTGNRRWLPFAIHNIDVDESFDIKLLYAQALKLWRDKKVSIWMTQQEIDEFEEYNEDFRYVPMEEELLLKYFRKPTKEEIAFGNEVEHLTTSDLIHAIASMDENKKMNVNDTSLKRLGKALKSIGFEKTAKRFPDLKNPRMVWMVKRAKWEDFKDIQPASGDENLF